MIADKTKLSDCLYKVHRKMLECAREMSRIYGGEEKCSRCLDRSFALEGMAYSVKCMALEVDEEIKNGAGWRSQVSADGS